MKKTYFLIAIVFSACQNQIKEHDCATTVKDIFSNYSDKVHVAYKKGNDILGISDNGYDKNKGGAYYFRPSGTLESYRFFQSDSGYNYEEKYDEKGQVIRQIGRPLVDERIREVNKDSAYFGFCFYSLHKTYSNISVYISSNLNVSFKFVDDTLCSNIKVLFFGMSTKGLDRFNIYLSYDYNNECGTGSRTIRDTLSLIKNPRLNVLE